MAPGFTEFDTTVGRCGIAWDDRAITGVWLPGTRRLRASIEPPARVEEVIDAVVALLEGDRRDLSWVPLDMEGIPDFDRRVYEVARTIPPGSTASYGDVAARLGSPNASRDVGRALARNPFAIVVPCHRVVGTGGEVGGFSAAGGVSTKEQLLAIEGSRAEQTSLFDSVDHD
jgi:methylated-DNA-[protein]-cysteine S-methyltransferase